MEYRRAKMEDIPRLVELRRLQLIDEGQFPLEDIDQELNQYFEAMLPDDTSLVVRLAEENGKIVATAGICFYQLPPSYLNPTGRIAHVINMYTLPDYRRRGIASHLLGLLIAEAGIQGYDSIRLRATKSSLAIYAKAGFRDMEGGMVLPLYVQS